MWHLRGVSRTGAQVDHHRPGGRADRRQRGRYVRNGANDKTVRTQRSGHVGEVRPVKEGEVVSDALIVELVELGTVTPVVTDDDDDRQAGPDCGVQLSQSVHHEASVPGDKERWLVS